MKFHSLMIVALLLAACGDRPAPELRQDPAEWYAKIAAERVIVDAEHDARLSGGITHDTYVRAANVMQSDWQHLHDEHWRRLLAIVRAYERRPDPSGVAVVDALAADRWREGRAQRQAANRSP